MKKTLIALAMLVALGGGALALTGSSGASADVERCGPCDPSQCVPCPGCVCE